MSHVSRSEDARGGRGRSPASRLLAACGPAVLVFLASCDSVTGLVDMDRFEAIPQVEDLDFGTVRPASDWAYWELRFSWGDSGADSVIGAGGRLAREELPPATRAVLDGLSLPTGFAGRCLPAWCFKFVAAVDDHGEVVTFATPDALASFLGEIGALAEAVLVLDALGYTWQDDDQGIRADGGEWEAVVLELVRTCAPIQTDRVLVRVSREGGVTVLRREVWRRLEGACI